MCGAQVYRATNSESLLVCTSAERQKKTIVHGIVNGITIVLSHIFSDDNIH